jgi:hypothetical protein
MISCPIFEAVRALAGSRVCATKKRVKVTVLRSLDLVHMCKLVIMQMNVLHGFLDWFFILGVRNEWLPD